MNTPNPLIPQGSRLEQHSHSRSRVKLAVFFVLTIHVVGLLALLVQGCKRDDRPPDTQGMEQPQAPVIPDFEPVVAPMDSNVAGIPSNSAPGQQPTPPQFEPYSQPTVPAPEATYPPPSDYQPAPQPAAQTYKIQSGDTFYDLAGKFGVTMQAIATANPSVDPNRLQIGQTINIPAPAPAVAPAPSSPSGETVYVVKSGDTLTKIADRFGTSVKAIRTANNLQTTVIRVGQKLVIPAAQPAPVGAPANQY